MARIWVSSIQSRSPVSLSTSLPLGREIASRVLDASRGFSCIASNSSLCSRSFQTVASPVRKSFSAAFFRGACAGAGYSIIRRISPLHSGFSGSQRLHTSSVVPQAAAGSVRVGGGVAKSKDREILVQHVLVEGDQVQLLLELQRKVNEEGLDLSDLAAEHSICPSKAEGGMLGWLGLGQTDPAFEEVAFSAPLNKVVRVKTKHGWHLLQVLNERQPLLLEQLPAEELHRRMQDPNFLENAQLIDVREPNEISTASIQGFEAYPLSQFGQWAPTITEDLDPEKDTYVMCHHGMRSMQAAQWLQTQGFRRLYNISGGIHAFATKVDPSIPTY